MTAFGSVPKFIILLKQKLNVANVLPGGPGVKGARGGGGGESNALTSSSPVSTKSSNKFNYSW